MKTELAPSPPVLLLEERVGERRKLMMILQHRLAQLFFLSVYYSQEEQ
jgi:hypothetical protein